MLVSDLLSVPVTCKKRITVYMYMYIDTYIHTYIHTYINYIYIGGYYRNQPGGQN
jgi:hypothetical protein